MQIKTSVLTKLPHHSLSEETKPYLFQRQLNFGQKILFKDPGPTEQTVQLPAFKEPSKCKQMPSFFKTFYIWAQKVQKWPKKRKWALNGQKPLFSYNNMIIFCKLWMNFTTKDIEETLMISFKMDALCVCLKRNLWNDYF